MLTAAVSGEVFTSPSVDAVLDAASSGDRTMVDALDPAATTFADRPGSGEAWRDALTAAVESAARGTAATAGLHARLGRSSYLGDRVLGHPDPGAQAVTLWLGAVATALNA
jgi:dihydroxyacetone kinase